MAAGLSYTSLLAIVPLTAIAFSMLAAFPVFESVKTDFQSAVFANLLPQSADAMREYFDGFVKNTASLSAVGIIALAATAVLLLGTIEADLNALFRVEKPRALAPRLLVFWAMITLGPLLLGASFSLSTYFFAATEWIGIDVLTGPLSLLTASVPTLIIIVLLTSFYFTIPNRPVSPRAALIGGVTAGLVFAVLRRLFGWYVATFPTYQNIYGALSVVPIFLVWMYLSWTIVLMGAVLTASLQKWRSSGGARLFGQLGAGPKLAASLKILDLLFEASLSGGKVDRRRILSDLGYGEAAIERLMESMRAGGFIIRAEDGGWVLSRDLDTTTLYDLFRALGLGFEDEDCRIDEGGEAWKERLTERLAALRLSQSQVMDVPLRDIVETRTGDKVSDSGEEGLRTVG